MQSFTSRPYYSYATSNSPGKSLFVYPGNILQPASANLHYRRQYSRAAMCHSIPTAQPGIVAYVNL